MLRRRVWQALPRNDQSSKDALTGHGLTSLEAWAVLTCYVQSSGYAQV